MMWDGHHPGVWLLFGTLWMLIFWGAVIWIVVWGASRFSGSDNRDENDALQIARRRYASGEITKEQFEQLRHDLRS